MQSDPHFLKVAVEIDDKKHLYNISKDFSLEATIHNLCLEYGKENASMYGLQFCPDDKQEHCTYITDKNFGNIVNGDVLKLVFSLKYTITQIFSSDGLTEEKLPFLKRLSNDETFVKELTLSMLQSIVSKASHCSAIDLLDYLEVLINIMRFSDILFINEEFTRFLIMCVKRTDYNKLANLETLVIQLLTKIVAKGDRQTFEFIYRKLKVPDLTPYLWHEDNLLLQYHTLVLINKYVQLGWQDSNELYMELSSKQHKTIIFKYVLKNAAREQKLAHEIYLYQTFLLSIYSQYLEEEVSLGIQEFQAVEAPKEALDFDNRSSIIDFDEKVSKDRRSGISSNFDLCDGASRRSTYNSQRSIDSLRTEPVLSRSEQIQMRRKRHLSVLWPTSVSKLTALCLEYYKKYYLKNYNMSILETNHEPGFYTIADQITTILCKILHINVEPDESCCSFHPLVFACYENKLFFEELFCRTLWLLARTRREMKANEDEDHEKVLAVLEYQIQLSLATQPYRLSILTDRIKNTNHQKVFDIWAIERKEKWKNTLETNPNLDILKDRFRTANGQVIYEQRMNVLHTGACFPKVPEKTIKGRQQCLFIYLSQNKRKFIYGDWNKQLQKFTSESEQNEIAITDIMHVVSGKACPHIRDQRVRKPEQLFSRCFSLLCIGDWSLDFLADDDRMAQEWLDGLHALLGKPMDSRCYNAELEMLTNMDLNLQLLELQDMELPVKPPPIPPLPIEFRVKPFVPPKSLVLTNSMRRTLVFNKNAINANLQ